MSLNVPLITIPTSLSGGEVGIDFSDLLEEGRSLYGTVLLAWRAEPTIPQITSMASCTLEWARG